MKTTRTDTASRSYVRTADTLLMVQQALKRAKKEDNQQLLDDAESVMSALVVTLRFEQAVLPAAVMPAFNRLLDTLD